MMNDQSPNPYSALTYFYDNQIKDYIIQFMAIFSGLQVKMGKNDFDPCEGLAYVPIRYGSADRVVTAIKSDNTTNKPIRIPSLSAHLAGIEMAPERRKGNDTTSRNTVLPRGGTIPDNLKVVQRAMPIPYKGLFDLSIIASNTDQHLQMLEQLLMLFNPILQIQTSDKIYDWTKITMVELTNINLEETIPAGTDKRLIVSSLIFSVYFYLSPPAEIKDNFIKSINLRIDAVHLKTELWDIIHDVTAELPNYITVVNAEDLDFPTS